MAKTAAGPAEDAPNGGVKDTPSCSSQSRAPARSRCFAVRRCGRWIGVARVGSDEHQTIAGYDTRREAVQAAREIATHLNDAALGIAWFNRLTPLERAQWFARANSAVPADAWAAFKVQTARDDGREVRRS
jgi:hypothetical protein